MCKYSIASCIVLLYLLCVTYGLDWSSRRNNFNNRFPTRKQTSNEFDVLIFTQTWPLTACFVWENKSRPNDTHSCSLPKRDEWTIHGIWPTKYNTIGPQFCNSALPFNPSAIAPIESNLKENWIDIHKGSKPYSFWRHEWNKHGTCAIEINALNTEFKYFQEGLKLIDKYNMIDVLSKANILPGNKYMVQDIFMGIQKVLNKRAQIMCVNGKKNESYVIEIRICFDKTLQLVDCDGIYNFPTNCDKSKPIIYPSRVPTYYATQI
ncbi:PREDICTED: ribonuclease Oy [Wasmannia auropunctata]|uniref:ribonuclease Oy n=1 Tax=Wasmannia auropunctata TaxID=64793 RepID=UPI0005EDEF96|nr:PREDICTED: ribonuclease Oy [Wasmannia auropunctata]